MVFNQPWDVAVVLIVLMTASVGQSHQVSVSIDHAVAYSPCPDGNPDCFPIYYWVCVDFLTDISSCPVTYHACNDRSHCSSMTMNHATFPQIRLPPQTVTNEKAIRVYIAESLTIGGVCRTPSVFDCRSWTTSYQFNNSEFSFQVILAGVPVPPGSVSRPIHTGNTKSVRRSHPVSVTIDHIVAYSPCPDVDPDCFPIYYWVCVDFLTDTSSCPVTYQECNDPGHCSSMKMDHASFAQLRLPPQTVTNENTMRVYIAESIRVGGVCRTPSAFDCRNLTSSFTFINSEFSFQVTLSGVPVTSGSAPFIE